MTTEKDLLLQDLCSRMPYGVKCAIEGEREVYTLNRIEVDYKNGHLFDFKEQKNGFNMQVYTSEVKPYLYPLSSMTKKQSEEFAKLLVLSSSVDMIQITGESTFDWLNRNMFDWRGLIPKGRAKDATGLNIY